jgi:hypothetical protein
MGSFKKITWKIIQRSPRHAIARAGSNLKNENARDDCVSGVSVHIT